SFFFQAEDGIRDFHVTGVQTCALPIYPWRDVSTEVYIAGEGFAAVDGPEHHEMPAPPRIWGPRRVNIFGDFGGGFMPGSLLDGQIGRASCRERVEVANVNVETRLAMK